MATTTITRGHGYWIQGRSLFTNKDQLPPDWTWYVGQYRQDWWTEAEYGAGCVEYYIPEVDDSLQSRTISIPLSFYGQTGMCEVFAVLSTKAPDDSLDFRYGPTSGIISNVEKTVFVPNVGVQNMEFNFTLTDAVGISGRTIYLYMYHPNTGFGTNGRGSSIVTKEFSDGVLAYSNPYTISISTDSGSTVVANRTSSGTSLIGSVANGEKIYYGDKIKITFSPKQNYKLITTIVNGRPFTSGNTIDITGDVAISATSQPLASDIGATNADIGSVSAITIMPYSNSYVHTVTYTFGELSGTIASRTNLTSYAWTVPIDFYNQIPNAAFGTCQITCETYDGESLLGISTCVITVRASKELCSPVVSGTVVDVNDKTKRLTGNQNVLVRYLSNANCTISAKARNGATIVSMTINGRPVTSMAPSISYLATDINRFLFVATDSRGYSSEYIVTPDIVPYVKLTLNPVLSRPFMIADEAQLSFSGNFFSGSFGTFTNSITIKYRYKLSTDTVYGEWIYIDPSNYTVRKSSYQSNGSISLLNYDGDTSGFPYQKSFDFQIVATDGVDTIQLSNVNVVDVLKQGVPVFDWGENDFNVNVALMLKNVNILDIMYPIGAVYMHSDSVLPTTVSNIGTWSSITTGVSNVYAWKRTE